MRAIYTGTDDQKRIIAELWADGELSIGNRILDAKQVRELYAALKKHYEGDEDEV